MIYRVLLIVFISFTATFLGTQLINPLTNKAILTLRISRVFMALINGAALSLSGAIYQLALRNPLADGFTTGASASCAFGAVLAISLGVPYILVPVAAFLSGILGLSFINYLSEKDEFTEPITMILAGITITIIASAIISFLKFLFEENILSVSFWMMGSIEVYDFHIILIFSSVFAVCMYYIFKEAEGFNLLSFDTAFALSTGADVKKLRKKAFALATLLVALSVSLCGTIAFVGLIIPHVVRHIFGTDAKKVFTESMVWGAIFLCTADTLSRTLTIKGAELPVGVITSMTGGIFFLYLLYSKRSEWHV